MTVYTPAMLGPFLEQCAPSNLTASAKTQAGQLAADAIALSAKVQALEANWPSFSYSASTKPSTSLPAKNPNGIREMTQTQTSRRASANSAVVVLVQATVPRRIPKPDRSIHNALVNQDRVALTVLLWAAARLLFAA